MEQCWLYLLSNYRLMLSFIKKMDRNTLRLLSTPENQECWLRFILLLINLLRKNKKLFNDRQHLAEEGEKNQWPCSGQEHNYKHCRMEQCR